MLKIHYHPFSTFSRRVRIALLEKKIPHELVEIDMVKRQHRSPEYLALNPYGRVPTLEEDGFVLYESTAILEYLELTRPDPPLVPTDPRGRALAAMHVKLCDIQLARQTSTIIFPKRFLPKDRWDEKAMAQAKTRDREAPRDRRRSSSAPSSTWSPTLRHGGGLLHAVRPVPRPDGDHAAAAGRRLGRAHAVARQRGADEAGGLSPCARSHASRSSSRWLVAACGGGGGEAERPAADLGGFAVTRLVVGDVAFETWLADSNAQRRQGFMFATEEQLAPLADGTRRGMLFSYPRAIGG